MKRIQYFIFICILGMTSLFSLPLHSSNLIWEDTNKLDLTVFKKNKDKKDYYSYNTTDVKGIPLKITLVEEADFYVEYVNRVGTPFSIEKKYYKDNLNLQQKCFKFYSFKYDYSYYYDHSGSITSKVDEEDKIDFSISSLHDMMLSKYNIDIYKLSDEVDDNYLVQRSINPTVYYIKKPLNMTKGTRILINGIRQDLYEVDATTGEIIASPTQASSRKNDMVEIIKKKAEEK